MKKIVKVNHIGDTRKGVSNRTGKEWQSTDIVVCWEESENGTEPYNQSVIGSVRGIINRDKLGMALSARTEIPVTMYFGVRDWNGRTFNNVEINLPKDYMLEAEPL